MSSKYVIKESTLNSIADAVRLRSGTESPIVVKDLPEAIKNIPDVGGYNIPNELLNCSGNCNHIFSSPLHNSFIKKYGSLINTNISNGTAMFCDNKTIENIPFEFNFDNGINDSIEMFKNCYKLKNIGDFNNFKPDDVDYMFDCCYNLRYLPNFNNCDFSSIGSSLNISECYSLRTIKEDFLKSINTLVSFYKCYTLDELNGLYYNHIGNNFDYCFRLKNITFVTKKDGTPYSASDATSFNPSKCGYLYDSYYKKYPSIMTSYNSGITADKQVTDDASYQALKNDPDWWTMDINYSRYNHDSAVRTINTLPIYTLSFSFPAIQFYGDAGSLTDGGAISNLTPEEIAVATSRNWTVAIL